MSNQSEIGQAIEPEAVTYGTVESVQSKIEAAKRQKDHALRELSMMPKPGYYDAPNPAYEFATRQLEEAEDTIRLYTEQLDSLRMN